MDGRPARAAVGYLACLVVDVALVWWTLAIWRWASKPETAWLRRARPDLLAAARPARAQGGTAIATVLTLPVVIAPGIENVVSSCAS